MWGWRATVLLLLLSAGAGAQSGDGADGADGGSRIRCSSHIATRQNNLTCWLLGGGDHEDDEDEGDSIKKMTLCHTDYTAESSRIICEEVHGNSICTTAKPVVDFNLTVELKTGGRISTMVNLRKIVKPKPPQVQNVTFNLKTHQVLIHINTAYHKDYLSVEDLLFQLHIWTIGNDMIQNVSSADTMQIDLDHLQRDTQYHVAVRSISAKYTQSSWSEWSQTLTFITPAEESVPEAHNQLQNVVYRLMACLVFAVLLIFSVVFFWKNRIFSFMWPNIPRPKDTLVHICKPNKGLLLNFSPEEFSSLRVCPVEKIWSCEDPEPSVLHVDRSQSGDPSSTQSSDCRSTTSVSTEELELSALLSWASSEGGGSLHSASPLPPPPEQNEGCGVNPQEEAYVTMSSFYQIK
ncbi:interleukin-7 receptor subunit alpha [Echeneis naucrates]|uniref:interleukin-7 receptor subunit alpha n=1 Tax=Echeneis naucrates TaxID=173247 RepID=UPI001113941F|nr:interleukin-7 receptor subunit alpha [Echeneis naucrates]